MRFYQNLRFYLLLFSFLLSITEFILVKTVIPDGQLQTIRLTQTFALTAMTYLYFVLVMGPALYVLKDFPFKARLLFARRALGVSTFYFSVLHASFAFFGQLGGFAGLPFLSTKYLLGISLSFTALIILTLMASTSFDVLIKKMGYYRWKSLHRFVYLAGILILIHALMLGTHFSDLSETIPQVFFIGLIVLLIVEANRFDVFLQKKIPRLPRTDLALLFTIAAIAGLAVYLYGPNTGTTFSLGIHGQHIQLAKEALQNQTATSNNPALAGDRSLRYSVNIVAPDSILSGQDVPLRFMIYNAGSGNKVLLFKPVYEKTMHLIIVNSELTYFTHIHPIQDTSDFVITTKFPSHGVYHLYVDFQPLGAIEQQFAFTVPVGVKETDITNSANLPIDTALTKTFGDYEVSLATSGPLKASAMTLGQQKLIFTLKDAKTKQPITTLKPYLASFGHLVMINQTSYDYLHVHPTNTTAPPPNANGGPQVEFLPIGIYGPFKPGAHRVFAQFNPDGNLFTADFTVQVDP